MKYLSALLLLGCLISLRGLAGEYDRADRYSYQLLGLMAPQAQSFSGRRLCLREVRLQDGFDTAKLGKEIEQEIYRQLSLFVRHQGLFELLDYAANADCQSVSIHFSQFSDSLEKYAKGSRTSEAFKGAIAANIELGQGMPALTLALDYSLPLKRNTPYSNHLPLLYAWSVYNKSRFVAAMLERINALLQGQTIDSKLQLAAPDELEWAQFSRQFGQPYALYRQRQFHTLSEQFTAQSLSYSLESLDAYCSALLDSGKYRDFFACMDIWDKSSFALLSGYRQTDLLTERPRPGNFDNIPYLVHVSGNKSATMYRREVIGRRNRLLADAYFQLGDYQQALDYARQALDAYKPQHKLWTVASKRYTPQAGETVAYRARVTWAFPGAAIDYHWAADMLLSAAIAAQSQLQVAPEQSIDKYIELIQQLHRNAQDKELLSQFPRIKNLFLNSIYMRAGQYERLRFSDSSDEDLASFGELASIALLIASLAVDDDYRSDVQGLASDVKAWSDEVLTPTYLDGAKSREQFQQAVILFHQAKPQAAIKKLQELIEIPELAQFSELKWQVDLLTGRVYQALKQPQKAIKAFVSAMTQIENTRGNISSESMKIGFVSQRGEVYGELMRVLVAQNQIVEAFNVAERARARALVDMLANSQLRRESQQADLPADLREMTQAVVQTMQPSPAADLRGFKLKTQSAKAVPVRGKLLQDLQRDSLLNMATLDYQSISQYLAADTIALEFVELDEQYLVFKLYQGKLTAHWLARDDASIQRYRQLLQNPASHDFMPVAQQLYRQWLAPLDLPAGGNLLISPAGKLNYLPFATLHDGKGYLVERFALVNLPSLTLLSLFPASELSQTTLALGNPTGDLPGAQSEVIRLQELEPKVQVLVQQQASETRFKQLAGQYSQLHIASHGEFNPSEPMLTRLRLAADQQNDGDLTLTEIYGLQLNSDLVVLSGCETGLSELAKGEEIIGLTRGFLYAGSNNILASLWQVSDTSTEQLMAAFYQHKSDYSYAEALRLAQVSLITRSASAHPFYWAAFVLTGKGRM